MSSSDTARSSIHLRSLNGPAQLRLLDHRMSPVAEGYGELQKGNLDPGLYLLEIDAGSHHEERILSLKAGEPYQDLQLDVAFPSAAPVEGTSTSHEYHAYPARDLSRQPNLKWGDGGRLMLFVRNLGGEMDRPIDFGALSLVDQGLAPLGGFLGSHDVGIASNGWAGLCADLDPGGYALECHLPPYPHSGSRGQELIQQTLWVAPGWTTLVFLPCLPGRRLPSLELASVHMAEIDAGFEPYEAEARQVNLAAELALNGMRTSQRLVPDDLLNLLLHAKFKNPMLGILGAHVLLQGPKTKWQLFDQVVENLKKMLGEAPDCTALEVLGQGRRRSETVSFSAVSWPPMLAAGYRALIAHDSDSPGLIEDGSVADHAAAVLHTSWPWSRWTRLEPEVLQELDDSGGFEMAVGEEPWNPPWGEALRTRTSTTRGAGVLGGVRSMDERAGESPTNEAARELLRQWLMERETEGKLIFPRKGEGPAVAQVTEYLQRMAEQSTYGDGRADLSRLTLSQLSRRVGLPVSTVRRAVSALVISGLSQK